MTKKLVNTYRDGLPVESGRPLRDRVVLRAIQPDEMVGALQLAHAEDPSGLFEVVALGPEACGEVAVGQIVMVVPEALRGLGSGEHLLCASKEIALVWDREQLEVEEPGLARVGGTDA